MESDVKREIDALKLAVKALQEQNTQQARRARETTLRLNTALKKITTAKSEISNLKHTVSSLNSQISRIRST